jgi:hypothetical protein
MAAYKKQLEASGKAYGEVPFESEYSESVMNGVLLKTAVDAAIGIFENCGDAEYAAELRTFSETLKENLTTVAWKEDFFARVLFNRSSKPDLLYLAPAVTSGDKEGAPAPTPQRFQLVGLSGCASDPRTRSVDSLTVI